MMALDGKTIIKEEITEKETYDSTVSGNTRRSKGGANSASSKETSNSSSSSSNLTSNTSSGSGNNPRSCRTPDSPESARVVAPRSPMSPQIHHSGLAPPPPPRPTRNASASPVVNGATTSPPPGPPPTASTPAQTQSSQAAAAVVAAAAAAAHVEQARVLSKIRKFLGSLVQLTQEVHPEVSERVRALVLSLASSGISIDEFRMALQEAINLPLRPYVIPLLKTHIALLQREIVALSRATNQSPLQYVTTNENAVFEFTAHGPSTEYNEIFVQLDAPHTSNGVHATSLVFKRRSSDTLVDHHNGMQDWNDYVAAYPPAKRLHTHIPHGGSNHPEARLSYASQPGIFDYSTSSSASQSEAGFNSLMEKANHRDERDLRSSVSNEPPRHPAQRSAMPPQPTQTNVGGVVGGSGTGAGGVGGGGGGGSGEEEWKNIHTMLNCISAMVDKTKRAITILQQRGLEPQQPNYAEVTPAQLVEIRRQTEEKVVEFKRSAEEAVNQVKRQAVIEIQRAVVAAETRAAEVMAQERLRMEKFFVEMSRHSGPAHERDMENKSPTIAAGQNACWNCGRKATETCSGCNLARYCGAFCQHKDWEHHHQICGTTRSTDLSAKHPSQVIPLSASIRAGLARSPPVSAPPAHSASSGGGQSQSASASANGGPAAGLVANGIGSK